MADLKLDQIRKSYGAVDVLHGIDLDVKDGEFVVFVGPSGCGKSTLLRIIAGLEDITGGDLMIDGDIVNTKSPRDRGIAMVFQSYALYPHMTVYKNMAFGLKLANHDKSAIDQRVREAARILQLDKLLDRRPSELSGGQRQRVAIGRAIVRQPKVFLFDEPLSNLDAALRVQTRIEIAKLHQELKSTIVYVTHDQVEAMTMADRMIVMNAGRVEQIGPPLEVYDTPPTLFAAQFIVSPSMNVFETTVQNNTISIGDITVPVNTEAKGKVTTGMRPEHVIVDDSGPLSITVQMGEPLGANTLLHGRLDGTSNAFTISLPGVHYAVAGQVIRFSVDPKYMHFFDMESGQRI